MSLSLNVPIDRAALSQSNYQIEFLGRNDAFSFWKLPEQWRATLGPTIGPSETAAERLLLEQYLPEIDRHPPSAMRVYYRVKRLIPQGLRHRLNSAAIRARKRLEFPHWPCESALVELWRAWLRQSLELQGVEDGWHIGFWPDQARCCIVLTHDVESPKGFDRMERLADLEEGHGFRSAWNLPLAQYPIDWQRVERLRARGFESAPMGCATTAACSAASAILPSSRLCSSGSPPNTTFAASARLRRCAIREPSPPWISTSTPVSPTPISTSHNRAEPAACSHSISRALLNYPTRCHRIIP